MLLSDFAGRNRRTSIEIFGRTASIIYSPSLLTGAYFSSLETESDKAENETDGDYLARKIGSVLTGDMRWTDDEPGAAGLPGTAETLSQLPLEFTVAILKQVRKEVQGGGAADETTGE